MLRLNGIPNKIYNLLGEISPYLHPTSVSHSGKYVTLCHLFKALHCLYIISLCVWMRHETITDELGKGCSVRKRFWVLISSSALLPQSPLLSIFQDIVRPADGVWRWDFRVCLNPSYREPLQGRWRADNPTARVGRLQNYRQTSAVESCCGAPSTGQHCEIWQCWLFSVSTKYILDCLDIRISHSLVASPFFLLCFDTRLSVLC